MTGSTHHSLSSRTVWDGPRHAWRNTSTWQTFLPNILAGSPERLWRRATSSVYLDHTAARVLVTVCLLLSALILSPSVPPLSTSITQYWDEYNDAETHTHTNTLAVSDTQTSTKKRESTKEETHIWSKQSVSECKRPSFWTGGECKVGFTQNHENTGYWISVEGRAEQQYSSKRLLWEAKCIHNEQKKLHLAKISMAQK